MNLRWPRAIPFLLLLFTSRCSCDEEPIPPLPDGNLIVGDAAPRDANMEDAQGDEDASSGDSDLPGDGGSEDAGDPDTGPPDTGDPCSIGPVATLTASEALGRRDLLGEIILVSGTATRTLDCTERACPSDMPCCNTCTATVTIEGLVPLWRSQCIARSPGCSGDECTQVCRPPLLGNPQRFRGKLVDDGGGAALRLYAVP